jgi:hypothetical protein
MSVIVVPLHIELYGDSLPFNEAAFRTNVLPLINQIWAQADVQFELRTVRRRSDQEVRDRLHGGQFHVNQVVHRQGNRGDEYKDQYEVDQLTGVGRGQPSTGLRICFMAQWHRTVTQGGVQRESNEGSSEGTLAAALGAGHFRLRGLDRTIVARQVIAGDAFLLAHELGHLLIGPGHVDRPVQGNLMARTSGRVYNGLLQAQRDQAHRRARHIPGSRTRR